ncbi:MAG: carboxypeptidase regulatory-like domain-containing protein [Planctomycetes bacterium]|nr:carboxypeptidase regulatory-like domain-containing protein [Planctomycetota bacterium]
MKVMPVLQRAAAALATLGMLLPSTVLAAPGNVPRARTSDMVDIALHEGGVLQGRVTDSSGQPQAGVPVRVLQGESAVANTSTDHQGNFRVAGLRGGVYRISTWTASDAYRLWMPRTAPPSAESMVVLTSGSDVARGQDGRFMNFITNPWVLGGIVAAAIAIPLALDDDDAS